MDVRSGFVDRHIGPRSSDVAEMLSFLRLESLSQLVDATVPPSIRYSSDLKLPQPLSELEAIGRARQLLKQNHVHRSFIGQGYYGTFTPPVVLRNVMENPAWYTAYTPYQAEIAQGRLEALVNFQTMICELTGMEIANSSLLDEGTAVAESIHLAVQVTKKPNAHRVILSHGCHPQTIEVVARRAEPIGLEVKVVDLAAHIFSDEDLACVIQYPGSKGRLSDPRAIVERARAKGVLVVAAADLLALTLVQPPGEWGADVVVGSSQRFGVPMGFGGPHAGYMATRDAYKRSLPGRLVGYSVDAEGNPALRLALQTREQHIRREKATSNICTAQVLLAVMASMYAVYHGPRGLKAIAQRTLSLALQFARGLQSKGHTLYSESFFDTVTALFSNAADARKIVDAAESRGINLRWIEANSAIGVSFDELSTEADVAELLEIFGSGEKIAAVPAPSSVRAAIGIPPTLTRTTEYLKQSVFQNYHSETEMLRYLRRLEQKDLSLVHSMIPLGSCTMKLNATTEMVPVTWPELGSLHPFAPVKQTEGIRKIISELESWLREITGFDAVSLQPNAGSAGEYAGLLAIRDYHLSRGDRARKVCLIPSSAHGTNPASAVMAGFETVTVACDSAGNVDVGDLRNKAEMHAQQLAALMITYPSTHGVFEEGIREICDIVHRCGGQVYMDGANFNALVGLCRPGDFGPDVCHLNLHKTFCIPHGGGGPGVGPIGVKMHLAPYLPQAGKPVAAAPFGSASILPISWAYIAMMGSAGLRTATETAILNANYVARRLEPHYPILYRGEKGWVAHECILDLRGFKKVSVEDVAKRLMDFGFHAPTMSWPVVGTLMVEPTESESRQELDRFCEAMIAIHQEIQDIETGKIDDANNPLKNAPHTISQISSDEWRRPYSRAEAAFPLPWVKERKFWPAVARINNPHGDRHLVCACSQ